MFYLWRPITKNLGAVIPSNCHSCGTETWVHLFKRRKWFTFLRFPLIPLESASYHIACRNCGANYEVDGDLLDNAKDMIETTDSLQDGNMDWENYMDEITAFSSNFEDDIVAEPPSKPDTEPRGYH